MKKSSLSFFIIAFIVTGCGEKNGKELRSERSAEITTQRRELPENGEALTNKYHELKGIIPVDLTADNSNGIELEESKIRDKTIAELRSDDMRVQSSALYKARDLGGSDIIFALVEVLSDKRAGQRLSDDEGVRPPRHVAAVSLGKLLPESPLAGENENTINDSDILVFKTWWEANSETYK